MSRTVLITLLSFQAAVATLAVADTVRFATYNAAMGLAAEGELAQRLADGDDAGLRQLAAVLQKVRPDVVLINEFDFQPQVHTSALLLKNYLQVSQHGQEPILYPHVFRGPVNTGLPSGLDLNDDGETDGPADAWGFGHFPGQYGMLVLSRYRMPLERVRTFQMFPWRDMPGAMRPLREDGSDYYPDATWDQLRLSSKSHWDLAIEVQGRTIHLLASHPTPPSFDGPEDRNGRRNHDEIRFWVDYVDPELGHYLRDDNGHADGLKAGAHFVIAGDLNADPVDGSSPPGGIDRLLAHPVVSQACTPAGDGGVEAARLQGQANARHQGDPAQDTADFSDRSVGNLRADYVLPSASLTVTGCGIFWPARGQPGAELIGFTDHRLVWVDVRLDDSDP